jgi:hypothetical protein
MGIMDYMPQWGQNTNQDVSGLPADDTMMQLEMKRRLDMAKALQQQEAPQGQMVSGHYVAPSWTQYAANLYGKYKGAQNEQQAIQDYSTAQQSKAQKLGDLMKGKTVFEPDEQGNQREVQKPYSNEELIGELAKIDPSYGPKLFENYLASKTKEDVGQVISPGGTLYKNGKAVYTAPMKEDKTTFSPLGKLTSELQTIQQANPNDPRIPMYQDAIKKETTASQGGESNIGKLTREMNLLAPNDPLRATYKAAIAKETRIAPEAGSQPPSGYRFGPNGSLVAIKGGPADKAVNPTESQSNANLFGSRAEASNKILGTLEGKYNPAMIQAQESAIGNVPGINWALNKAADQNTQSAAQAQRDFVTAILRKESGASISSSEFEQARKQYFPQPGDSLATIKQKAANRQTAINGIKAASGPMNNSGGKVVVDY